MGLLDKLILVCDGTCGQKYDGKPDLVMSIDSSEAWEKSGEKWELPTVSIDGCPIIQCGGSLILKFKNPTNHPMMIGSSDKLEFLKDGITETINELLANGTTLEDFKKELKRVKTALKWVQ